jgi:uncharacterized protein YukE
MSDEVVINFEQVDQMVELLRNTAKMLRDQLMADVNKMAQMTQEALVGDAGDAFENALRANLNPAVERLAAKLEEQAGVVERERWQLFEAFKPN